MRFFVRCFSIFNDAIWQSYNSWFGAPGAPGVPGATEGYQKWNSYFRILVDKTIICLNFHFFGPSEFSRLVSVALHTLSRNHCFDCCLWTVKTDFLLGFIVNIGWCDSKAYSKEGVNYFWLLVWNLNFDKVVLCEEAVTSERQVWPAIVCMI